MQLERKFFCFPKNETDAYTLKEKQKNLSRFPLSLLMKFGLCTCYRGVSGILYKSLLKIHFSPISTIKFYKRESGILYKSLLKIHFYPFSSKNFPDFPRFPPSNFIRERLFELPLRHAPVLYSIHIKSCL